MMKGRAFLSLLLAIGSSSFAFAQEQGQEQNDNKPDILITISTTDDSLTDTDPSMEELPVVNNTCSGPSKPGALLDSLLKGYDKRDRPSLYLPGAMGTEAPPDDVEISIHILELEKVDQKLNQFELTINFRRAWTDPRLAYRTRSEGGCFPDGKEIVYKGEEMANIWTPDLYFGNQADKTEEVGDAVWLDSTGYVFWSTQMDLTLSCEMQFKDFPYDQQECGIDVAKFASSDEEVQLVPMEWKGAVTMENYEENELPRGGTPEWNILKVYPVIQEGDNVKYSSMKFIFELQRKSEYYSSFVIQPCIMFVTIAYASFFVNRSAAPARVGMSTIGFLANTNFLVAQLGQIPRLGKDVFLLKFVQLCVWFCFYSIIEYALCNYLRRIQGRLDAQRKHMKDNTINMQQSKTTDEEEERPKEPKYPREEDEGQGVYKGFTKADIIASDYNRKMDTFLLNPRTGRMYLRDESVDIFSRWAFPVAFVSSAVAMWYTKQAD